MPHPRRIVVVAGGVGHPSSCRRLADRLAGATTAALAARHEAAAVRVVEVRDLAHDVVEATLTGVRSPALAAALRDVEGADGVIAVSPVFNASIGGLFKAFADLIEPRALTGVPVAIGITAGSDRHSLVLDHALRPVLAYLGAAVVPTGVHACGDDLADGPRAAALEARIARAAAELAVLVSARPLLTRAELDAGLASLLHALD